MSESKSLNILLVEDNVANQLVATAYLKREGHRVVTARTGLEAIECFHLVHYDLVLMDLQMPVVDGLECARFIRGGTHNSDVPIIALTANVLRVDQGRCLSAGMNGYFSKPISWDDLLTKIDCLTAAA